uniref:Uncharacterized protein n=1 Tax=Cannabis sativa TaxID=3483 RepID=A0A803PQE4_CANSA
MVSADTMIETEFIMLRVATLWRGRFRLRWELQIHPVATQLISRKVQFDSSVVSVGSVVDAPSLCIWASVRNSSILFDRLSRNAFELMMATIWWLWYDRNSMLIGNKQSRLDVAPDLAYNNLSEFKEYGRRGLHSGGGLANPVVNRPTRWMTPPLDSFALAMDAWWFQEGFVGLGGVIRDAAGVVWLA